MAHLGFGSDGAALCRTGLCAAVLMAFVWNAAAQKPAPRLSADKEHLYTEAELERAVPTSPNPYVSFLPEGVEPDWRYWRSKARVEAEKRGKSATLRALDATVPESESNDTLATADPLPQLDTTNSAGVEIAITGSSTVPTVPATSFTTRAEDNGSITLASATPWTSSVTRIRTTSTLGDGPHGSGGTGSGDFDFFKLTGMTAGMVIVADIDTAGGGFVDLDSYLAIYNSAGTLLAGVDDDGFTFDSLIVFEVPSNGDYYLSVGSWAAEVLSNPFDSSSGPGAVTEGDYTLTITATTPSAPVAEDNGSIPLATAVSLQYGVPKVFDSYLGDGPHGGGGSGSGDFDFYRLSSLPAHSILTADVSADVNGSSLDSFLAVWDSSGELLALNDDDFLSFDSLVQVNVPSDGILYVSVGAYLADIPADPFDSSSGPGAASEGPYLLALTLNTPDPDYFKMTLRKGDIVGGSVLLGTTGFIDVLDASGDLLIGSAQDASFLYPAASTLPGGIGQTLAYVIAEDGTYYLRLRGFTNTDYTCMASVFRPVLEQQPLDSRQILFLDFNGASVNAAIFGGSGVRNLSPLSSFLAGWGLSGADENAVIDAIVAATRESIETDIEFPGGNNPLFDIEIRNSRDHADPFGQANVSRVIVGGTISELGLSTIGIAESIDPGNFETKETGVVLLDLLSAPAPDPNSLNSIARTTGIIPVIAQGVGNIVSHEAGHFFGNYHTEQFVTHPNIMDQGGNLLNTVGVGGDNTFGTGDDIDVDFGTDIFVPNEGFLGVEDTLNTVAFGLSTPVLPGLYVNFNASTNGNGSFASPFKFLGSAIGASSAGGTIRIFSGTTTETPTIAKPLTLHNHTPGTGVVRIGN